MTLLDNKTYTYMIYDHKGKCIGFNDDYQEAREVAEACGGHINYEEVVDNEYNNENYSGCPHCGSYEGDYQECPECGHGQ